MNNDDDNNCIKRTVNIIIVGIKGLKKHYWVPGNQMVVCTLIFISLFLENDKHFVGRIKRI